MKISPAFRAFFGISVLIFLVNMLLTNDYTTLWNGAEIDLLNAARGRGVTAAIFPLWKMQSILNFIGFQPFMLRLPAVCITALSLVGFWYFGKKIFGERTVLLTILVLMSSFLLPNLSKLATADAWLFGSHLLTATTLILYLKKRERNVLIACFLFALLGLGANFWSTAFFILPLLAYWFFRHPQGKNIPAALLGGLTVVVSGLLFFWKGSTVSGAVMVPFSVSFGNYFGFSLLGILPWIAFLPAAFIDTVNKLKRKEELSILTSGWLLAALLSFSVSLQTAFALLIAKQVVNYFDPKYPYTNWVKTFTALHIVAAFIGGIALMLNGFYLLEAEGFRLAMSVGAVYWITAFIGVVGVYGKNRKMLIGGTAASGLLLTFFFWVRVAPVTEVYRNTPKKLTEAAQATEKPGDLYLMSETEIDENILFYAREDFKNVTTMSMRDLQSLRPTVEDVVLYRNEIPAVIPVTDKTRVDTVVMRNELTGRAQWLLLK